MRVRDRIAEVALEKDLSRSTVLSYRRLLGRLGILDLPVEDVTKEDLMDALWRIDNTSTRRSAIIALRSVLGIKFPIPEAVPRKYDLPDEDTLKLALMTSPHEIRGLLMMYAGLRVGEACAITEKDVVGKDRLRVDKQVQQLHETGKPTTVKIRPVKTGQAAEITIPYWLAERLVGVTETAKPDCVRESLRRAGQKVGINLNPHMLRHWFGSTLWHHTKHLKAVQEQLRHKNPASTMVYTQIDVGGVVHDLFG